MKFTHFIAAAVVSLGLAGAATQSDAMPTALAGSDVTGTLQFGTIPQNFFDPANGFVPGGSGNSGGPTVTIDNALTEFSFLDSFSAIDADFQDGLLSVSHEALTGGVNFASWTMTFVSSAFVGATFAETSDGFPGGVTGSLSGDTITVDWAGGPGTGVMQAVFSLTSSTAAIPLPATLPMLLAALLGGGALLRRRA